MNFTLIMSLITFAMRHQDDIAKVFNALAPALQGGQQPQYDVRWLQQSLNKLANTRLTVDGEYGAATREAVRQFQQKYMPGEAADGWAGVKTTAAILAALNKGA